MFEEINNIIASIGSSLAILLCVVAWPTILWILFKGIYHSVFKEKDRTNKKEET